jgi:hypothetical protein
MDEIYIECCQQMLILQKIEQKINKFMLVSFKTNPQIKCSSHNLKPYFIYFEYEIYSSSTTFKPYKC